MIRLKDLSLHSKPGLSASCFLAMTTTYSPLVNYTWSMTTSNGLRYLKGGGTSQVSDASMYFGRGAYLNGVDQGVAFNTFSPLSENTIIFNINNIGVGSDYPLFGSSSYANYRIMYRYTSGDYWNLSLDLRQFGGSIVTTNYILPKNTNCQICIKEIAGVISIYSNNEVVKVFNGTLNGGNFNQLAFSSLRSQYGEFTFKDVYMFRRALTQAEITQAYEQPEAFYAMAQADSTCVLNMPMCETDGYVRNMKSYNVGTNLDGINLSSTISGAGNTIVQDVNVFNISSVGASKAVYHPLIAFPPNTFTSDLYNIEVEVKCISGTLKVARLECTRSLAVNDILTAGTTKTYSLVAGFEDIGGRRGSIIFDGLNYPTYTAVVTVKKVEKITAGLYPIINYTSSVRDNAKNLQYGLQTCKFVRDSLGVIQSASNYLECDGVGYIKTQWVPKGTDVFTLETVITPALVSKLQTHGNYGTSINEVQIGVTSSNLVFASSLNSETVYLPYTENMHVCIVSDGVQSYYYCNNVLIKTTYNNSGSTVNPFAFGGVNSGTIFNPTYDTLRLFKIHAIAYTSSQVDAAYYALAKKNTIAYDVIPDECLYDENGNVYIDESGNYIGVDGYVMDESGEYYIV